MSCKVQLLIRVGLTGVGQLAPDQTVVLRPLHRLRLWRLQGLRKLHAQGTGPRCGWMETDAAAGGSDTDSLASPSSSVDRATGGLPVDELASALVPATVGAGAGGVEMP